MSDSGVLRRRAFLGGSAAFASCAGGLERLLAAGERPGNPVNIVWMVADGMSAGVIPLAERLSYTVRRKGTLWHALLGDPKASTAFMEMASLNSPVTDSSAASSSWGSGSRIFNGWVNMLPNGTALVPLGSLAHDSGKRFGLVTTTTVSHATPAGFAAVSKDRDNEAFIAEQYIKTCDVLLGGGSKFFDAKSRRDGRDLWAEYRKAGFTTLASRQELLDSNADRIVGIFSPSHLPFTIDRDHSASIATSVPTLAEMTAAALKRLAGSPRGFLLQVEGGRVDHAAHNNDAAAQLWEQVAFDDAIEVVLKFAEKDPETLVVITTDHGNSNPGLNGMGTEYVDSGACFRRLTRAKASFTRLIERLGGDGEYKMNAGDAKLASRGFSPETVREAMRDVLGIDITSDEAHHIAAAAGGDKGQTINRQFSGTVGVLGQVVANYYGIGWTGTSHTSDYSVLTALGPGSGRFKGYLRNTEVFPTLCSYMGIKHRNPSMTPKQAAGLFEASSDGESRIHWV